LKLLELKACPAESFKKKFLHYIRPYYQKGLPSLFSEIKSLYKDAEQVPLMEYVFVHEYQSLKDTTTFTNTEEKESPCCFLWSCMLLASHFDYTGKYKEALEYIDQAIKHTPTLLELYLIKAKIFKHTC
jgi:peptide alpha-N-acetyltransferase